MEEPLVVSNPRPGDRTAGSSMGRPGIGASGELVPAPQKRSSLSQRRAARPFSTSKWDDWDPARSEGILEISSLTPRQRGTTEGQFGEVIAEGDVNANPEGTAHSLLARKASMRQSSHVANAAGREGAALSILSKPRNPRPSTLMASQGQRPRGKQSTRTRQQAEEKGRHTDASWDEPSLKLDTLGLKEAHVAEPDRPLHHGTPTDLPKASWKEAHRERWRSPSTSLIERGRYGATMAATSAVHQSARGDRSPVKPIMTYQSQPVRPLSPIEPRMWGERSYVSGAKLVSYKSDAAVQRAMTLIDPLLWGSDDEPT